MATAIILVVAVGLVCSVLLAIASKVFFVPVDETFAKLRECLPGANCGGCGYAGCDDYANAMTADPTTPCNKCPVGGASVAEKLGEVLGVSAGGGDKQVAVVQCNGVCGAKKPLLEYTGTPRTCVAAKTMFSGTNVCIYGCMGLGDCERACSFDAIHIVDGVAKVDRSLCVACGACAAACPNQLIRISPEKNLVIVHCSNKDKGAVARKACDNACIGCMKCEKTCKFDAVHVENNLAYIDPDKCKNCGMCAKECPTGAIINLRLAGKKAAPKPPTPPAPAPEEPKAEGEATA